MITNRLINKILLVGLPAVLSVNDNNINDENVLHLGLAYVAAILRRNNFDVRILDCYAEDMFSQRISNDKNYVELGLSDNQILEIIFTYKPDLIGISIPFSCQQYVSHHIASLIKKENSSIIIVAGGNHVTAIPNLIDESLFDYLIIGEGEASFISLLDDINNNHEPPRFYPGRCKSNNIKNLDELPYPALDLMPLQKLWKNRRRWINMIATRGCVYECNFCSIHSVMGNTIRRRSIENIISEILMWKKTYNIQEIYFEDDNLTANKKWAKELFQKISELNLGIRFYVRNGIRADTIDKELLILMRSAGFFDFMISPESGSQKTLDEIIGKMMRLEDSENAIRLAKEVGLGINVFFVIGFPDENWEDIKTTVNYAKKLKKLGAVGFWISTATPYPGTRLYQDCLNRGLINEKELDYRRLRTPDYIIEHPVFSREELMAFRKNAMEELKSSSISIFGRITRGLSIFRTSPSFFIKRLKFKLNL